MGLMEAEDALAPPPPKMLREVVVVVAEEENGVVVGAKGANADATDAATRRTRTAEKILLAILADCVMSDEYCGLFWRYNTFLC